MIAAVVVCFAIIGAPPTANIDFATEIMPVLTKAGCNTGACHGAAAGRGGFHLSLLGGDAAADYESIVHAFEGRRINLDQPSASLLLKKPTGYLDHGGDIALPEDSAGAAKILSWIKAGAPRGDARRLTAFRASPSRQVSAVVPTTTKFTASARFNDGPWIDVTPWTVFTPADAAAIRIYEDANNTTWAIQEQRGPHVVIARFLDRVVPLELVVPLADNPIDLAAVPRVNFIDELILQQLGILRIPISPQAVDAVFLRRVRLDLTGRLPTPAEVKTFQEDKTADKRAQLIDRLLVSDDFADYWTLRFARLLRLHSLPNEKEGAVAYAKWIRQQLSTNRPFREWAHELLVATGDTHHVGAANFSCMVADARGQAELVGEIFLGARLGCANCHHHPLDRWTQDDYHGFAAVFARLERNRYVQQSARGDVTNPRTGEPATPRIPGVRDLPRAGDSLAMTAEWLISNDNKLFARATVNRLWQAMFGHGLVEPVDDLRETNPASHPELLTRLADDFVQHGYDLRHTLRLIASSSTYACGSEILRGNEFDDRFCSRMPRRTLGPEVLADAIADVTGVPDEFAGQPTGTRAVAVVDPLSPAPALDTLGRCSRVAGCADAKPGNGLSTQLHLLNGELINRKLIDKRGHLQQLLAAGADDEQIVREFYVRGLSRQPSSKELQRWVEALKAADATEHQERCEDFVWSLLNSREFTENH